MVHAIGVILFLKRESIISCPETEDLTGKIVLKIIAAPPSAVV
jgi:hypothetical protein